MPTSNWTKTSLVVLAAIVGMIIPRHAWSQG